MIDILVIGGRASNPSQPGRLAQSIIDYVQENTDLSIEHGAAVGDAGLIVYCRRIDDLLDQAIDHCNKTKTPLAFLSSGIDADLPADIDFAFIEMRNASVDVIEYMQGVAKMAKDHPHWEMKITEHHQPSKKDVSGTALKITEMTGYNASVIESVRDRGQTSQDFDIPESAQDGYAIHRTVFYDDSGREACDPIDMVVIGRDTYARGVVSLYRALMQQPVDKKLKGRLDILDLVGSRLTI